MMVTSAGSFAHTDSRHGPMFAASFNVQICTETG
jgi:hypothetical protein